MAAVFRSTQLLLGVAMAAIVVCTVRANHAADNTTRELLKLE